MITDHHSSLLVSSKANKKNIIRMKMMITFVISYFMLLNLNPLEAQLSVGFYADKCPTAESVVRAVIRNKVTTDPRNAAVLLRLQFHDCFVLVNVIFLYNLFFFFLVGSKFY